MGQEGGGQNEVEMNSPKVEMNSPKLIDHASKIWVVSWGSFPSLELTNNRHVQL